MATIKNLPPALMVRSRRMSRTPVAVVTPPGVSGSVADQTYTEQTGVKTVATAAAFTGSGLSYSLVTPVTGVSINAVNGIVAIDTATTGVIAATTLTVRASNVGGFADVSFDLTVVITPPAVTTAYFGTSNNAGEADFDTGNPALNGTDGPVTVTNGVISLNTSSPAAGSYSPDGFPVVIDATNHAVGNQTEWDRATNGGIGSIAGRHIRVRRGAAIGQPCKSGNSQFFRTQADVEITGDGHLPWETTAWHFGNVSYLDNIRNVTFNTCSFRSMIVSSASGQGYAKNVRFRGCHFGDDDPDVTSNVYATSGYSHQSPFSVTFSGVRGLELSDCTIRGGDYAQVLFYYENWGVCRGNHFDKYYHDGMKIRGDAPLDCSGNVFTNPFSLSSDTGGPHSDGIQLEGCKGSWITFGPQFYAKGSGRGNVSADHYIAGGTGTFKALDRAIGIITGGIYGWRAGPTQGYKAGYNAVIPWHNFHAGNASTLVGYNIARCNIDSDSGGGTVMSHSFGGTVSLPGTVGGGSVQDITSGSFSDPTGNANVELRGLNAAGLTQHLPNWALTSARPSMWEILQAVTPAVSSELDGKGPAAVVSLASSTTPYSQYTLDAAYAPVPVASLVSVTPGTTDFSAVVTTDQSHGTKFWAVFPSGTTVTAAMIKEATTDDSTAAVDAGYVSQTTSGTQTITGTPAALTDGVSYVLAVVHEIDSVLKSNVDTLPFQAGSGADVTAPTLTVPAGASTGETTASGSVTTDEDNGTLYAVASTSATAPSVAQIKAGQDSSGSAAVWSGNQAITTTGSKAISVTGLTQNTGYYNHYFHEDAAGNQSAVVSSAQYTTDAAPSGGVAYVTSSLSTTPGNSNNIDVDIPAHNTGDKVIIILAHERGWWPTNPAGWDVIGSVNGYTVGLPRVIAYSIVSDGSLGSSINIPVSNSKPLTAVCLIVTGSNSVGSVAGNSVLSATQDTTVPLTASADSAILHVWSRDNGRSVDAPNTPIQNGGTTHTLCVEVEEGVSAGATTGRTATSTASGDWIAMQIEIPV